MAFLKKLEFRFFWFRWRWEKKLRKWFYEVGIRKEKLLRVGILLNGFFSLMELGLSCLVRQGIVELKVWFFILVNLIVLLSFSFIIIEFLDKREQLWYGECKDIYFKSSPKYTPPMEEFLVREGHNDEEVFRRYFRYYRKGESRLYVVNTRSKQRKIFNDKTKDKVSRKVTKEFYAWWKNERRRKQAKEEDEDKKI